MTRDLKPGDKVKWFTSSEWPEPVGIVKEITPKRVKIEVTRIDEQSSVHYVKKTSLIKVHEPSNISQSQANSLNVESSVQDKILSVVVASVIVGGLLFIAGIFGNVSGEFLFWGVFGSAVGTFCIGIILIVLENVFKKKSSPDKVTEDPNQLKIQYLLKLIALCIVLLLFFAVWPIYEIQVGCPDRTEYGAPQRLDCSLAHIVYPVSFIIGIILAGNLIWQRIRQGVWLALPGSQANVSQPKVSYNIISGGRAVGLIILGLLFVISPLLGTSVIFVGTGFLAGGATAFLVRGVIDFVSLFPKSIAAGSEKQ